MKINQCINKTSNTHIIMSATTESKKRSSKAMSSSENDDMLNLTKAVISLKKTQETFMKSVDSMDQMLKNHFEDLDLRIKSKERECQELQEQVERAKKSAKIDIDQDVRAHGYEAAKRLLAERKEVPIVADELKKLQDDLRSARTELAKTVEEAVKAANDKAARHLGHELKTRELEYAAKSANTDAALKQKDSEINVLKTTIADLRSEIEKQRTLTSEVASSLRPQYVPSASSDRDRR